VQADELLTVLAVAALSVAIIKWPRIWRMLRFPSSSSWPTSTAIVEQAVVQSYSGGDGTTYRAEIMYSYQVNGEHYGGCCMGDLLLSEAAADRIVEQYPKGTTVQIHVHPTKPQLSFLNL
jgi:uncharacterized protein DUF3592